MKRAAVSAAVLLSATLFCSVSFAEDSNELSQLEQFRAKLKPALDMFTACHYDETMENEIEDIEDSLVYGWHLDHLDKTKDEINKFAESLHATVETQKSAYWNREALEYIGTFTPEEISALADFCRTPIGNQYALKRVELVKKWSSLDYRYLRNLIATAAVDAEKRSQKGSTVK